jgi:probable H4MPT-linked C1 transfer pathway protein
MAIWLGLDIGGANIKLSDGVMASSVPFQLWKVPDHLPHCLDALVKQYPQIAGFAVTMTGELADCFETKAEGVDFILSAVEQVAEGRPIVVWQTGAEFVPADVAREIPLLVAAANWHALATWVGRMVPLGLSLLLDTGSTTTDIIPLWNGVPIPTGMTDRERLASGELVYSGVRRTPLCAVTQTVPFRGSTCSVAAELFATMLDVFLILGIKIEDPKDLDTANGKPATKACAHDRLARMICCDRTEVHSQDALAIAKYLAVEQSIQIGQAIRQVLSRQPEPLAHVLISGSGSFVLEALQSEMPVLNSAELLFLNRMFHHDMAESACAFAVARLAEERVQLS